MIILEQVTERLKSFGYEVEEGDTWMLGFCIEKVENHIKNLCNITTIPDELMNVEIDRICGEFLFNVKQAGKLNETFNMETVVKSIQTGDTNVSFDVGSSSENRMDSLIGHLMTRGDGEFLCYRKVKW